jgi:putative selenate reductase FAD-binding subunit
MIEHFHRPVTVRAALGLKRRFTTRAVFLAGGTFVNSNAFPLAPEHCISLAGLKLDRISRSRGGVAIGALCTLQQLIDDRKVPAPLRVAALQVVSRNVRNMATLGGHVASRLPNSDLVPTLVALGAKLALAGSARKVPVLDYVANARAGLITRILVPASGPGRVTACAHHRASANARSLVSAAVSLNPDRGRVRRPVIALGGVGGHVVRLTAVEKRLDGKPLPATDELQALVSRAVRPASDHVASAAFRRHQAGVVVARAFDAARGRKAGPS